MGGSYRLKMYRQALGIINEIKEQEDPSLQRIYLTVACQIHCANEDLPHAVKVFRRAVANTDMDTALSIWAGLQSELRNIGADATAKGAVELLVHSEEDRSKLAAFEQLDEITQTLRSGFWQLFSLAFCTGLRLKASSGSTRGNEFVRQRLVAAPTKLLYMLAGRHFD